MSVDLSKIGYGAVVSQYDTEGLQLSKIGYGIISSIYDGDGIHLSKIGYGVIVDTSPSGRRNACRVVV